MNFNKSEIFEIDKEKILFRNLQLEKHKKKLEEIKMRSGFNLANSLANAGVNIRLQKWTLGSCKVSPSNGKNSRNNNIEFKSKITSKFDVISTQKSSNNNLFLDYDFIESTKSYHNNNLKSKEKYRQFDLKKIRDENIKFGRKLSNIESKHNIKNLRDVVVKQYELYKMRRKITPLKKGNNYVSDDFNRVINLERKMMEIKEKKGKKERVLNQNLTSTEKLSKFFQIPKLKKKLKHTKLSMKRNNSEFYSGNSSKNNFNFKWNERDCYKNDVIFLSSHKLL